MVYGFIIWLLYEKVNSKIRLFRDKRVTDALIQFVVEHNLYVTESGEKLVPVIREILRDWAKSVTRDLSDEERILLITLLDRLIHTDVE